MKLRRTVVFILIVILALSVIILANEAKDENNRETAPKDVPSEERRDKIKKLLRKMMKSKETEGTKVHNIGVEIDKNKFETGIQVMHHNRETSIDDADMDLSEAQKKRRFEL